MNRYSVINRCLLALLMLLAGRAWAYTYTCEPKSGTPTNLAGDFGTVTISDPTQNTAGQTFDAAASWNTGKKIPVRCDTPNSASGRRFTATSPLPVSSNDGTRTWYRVNEYLDTAIKINANGLRYIPFKNLYTASGNDSNGGTQMSAGSSGVIDLKIVRPFVGTTSFDNIHVADVFLSHKSGVYSPNPIAEVYLNGIISVPQNCTVNAGTIISVDLGTVYASDFKAPGEKPANYTPKSFSFPIQCNYGASLANLTLRVDGTASADNSNALQSNNPDVGVIVTDDSGTILAPNNLNSALPLQLNQVDEDNYSTTVTLEAYPVNTTGKPPAEGTFTTLALLRVDFA
ncbi:type 1 fimbria pilin [Raoultella sp. BIGb0399]|uniref:fimbrial protein n=1 Tax=Raoultella sp. BIGb0399 TaxID=2485119 RepID=UPI000F4CB152|nr:fimbrial protein [Raoultella sp. BIGb0399]ROS15278.1 type 1 fimbria pilin [Raoultella sp. BIGb0399]